MPSQHTPLGSKLDSASLLILGMEGLRPGGCTPVSKAAVDAADTVHDAVDRQRYGTALTCAVLYPIVVELVVKHIWEQKHGKTAKYHHNVHSLFMELAPEVRRDVEALYDQCCHAYKSAMDIGQQQHGAEVVAVDMANLEEALRWNEEAVKSVFTSGVRGIGGVSGAGDGPDGGEPPAGDIVGDRGHLKYEMTPRGQSVPTGIFWSSKHVWIVPGTFPNFAIELTRWAVGCNFANPSTPAASTP